MKQFCSVLAKNKILSFILMVIVIIGLVFRLSNINYGLPFSYYIDETDHTDPAVSYITNYKTVIKNHDFNFFRPSSYVYGTNPTYFLSISVIVINAVASLFGLGFSEFNYVVVMRIVTVIVSMSIPIVTGYLYYLLYKDKKGLVISVFLSTFNWKLINHSIYVNQDIFLALSVIFSYLFLFISLNNANRKKSLWFTCLSGSAFGLAFGTKITALISAWVFGVFFIIKKNWRGLILFGFLALITFFISNPFSLIAFKDFISRLVEMRSREGGVVFGSVDLNPFKYIINLNHMLTLPILLISIFGAYKSYKIDKTRSFHLFLFINVVTYVVFFSLAPRNSERYLLPTLPVIIIYASYGISYLYNHLKVKRFALISILSIIFGYYLFFSISLFLQLTHNKPRVDAYNWVKQNIPNAKILVYTEEGRDPFKSIRGAKVIDFSVYVSRGAQFVMPVNPEDYEYVVLSSKPMENFKRDYVVKTYPEYSKNWMNFENLVTKSEKFELVKEFKNTNLNLLYFSDIFIYKRT